jgi:hypothetical protein
MKLQHALTIIEAHNGRPLDGIERADQSGTKFSVVYEGDGDAWSFVDLTDWKPTWGLAEMQKYWESVDSFVKYQEIRIQNLNKDMDALLVEAPAFRWFEQPILDMAINNVYLRALLDDFKVNLRAEVQRQLDRCQQLIDWAKGLTEKEANHG